MDNKFFGKKIGMTRYFLDGGECVSVTLVKAEPCVVIQRKTADKDGYEAIQVGFDEQKESRLNKPMQGHFKTSGDRCFRNLREVHVDDSSAFELGQEITADMLFQIGDVVNVAGKSKGRGFAGVMKRWGFGGGRKTHGSRSHRIPGSIGSSATPGRVMKGKKMPGRMGNQRLTVKNLKVIDIRPEVNLIALKGSVPGSSNGIIEITKI